MSEELESISDGIIRSLDIRIFPDDYLPTDEKLTEFELPPGEEIMMYRELEGVFVMFDYERIFFKDPYEAKYVYYCAKRGMARIRMPGTKTLKKLIKEFQSDMENARFNIEKKAEKFNLSDDERSAVVEACSRKLGYHDIMDI